MGFVDHQQTVCWQVIKQRRRRLARPAPGEEAGVVFDAGAVAQLVHHLQVELGTLAEALLFQQLIVRQQHFAALGQLHFDLFHRLHDTLARRHVVRFRVDGEALDHRLNVSCQRVEERQAFDLLVKQLNAQRHIVRFRREDVDHFAAHAERTTLEGLVIAGVLQLRQAAQNRALVDDHPLRQVQHHLEIEIRIAQAVNRRNRGHHNHIATLQQRLSRRQSHLLNVFVHRRIFLDEGIRARHIGFWLVVIVVGDEILNGVFREELFHLAVKLRRQGFVGRQHHRRALEIRNHVGNGKGFTRAGNPEQRLVRQPILQPLFQTTDRFRLIARRTESRIQFERFTHGRQPDDVISGR